MIRLNLVLSLAVLVSALISEAIDRSTVPRKDFWIMGVSVLAPILSALIYLIIFGGKINFDI